MESEWIKCGICSTLDNDDVCEECWNKPLEQIDEVDCQYCRCAGQMEGCCYCGAYWD